MKKQLILSSFLTSSILLFSGCSTTTNNIINDFQQKINHISFNKKLKKNKNLPIPFDLKYISSETSISLEWMFENKEQINGFNIYRAEEGNNKLLLIDRINNKHTTHFVDNNLKPNTKYTYIITSYNDTYESDNSPLLNAQTYNTLPPINYLKASNNLVNMIKIVWRPDLNPNVKGYIIEKQVDKKWIDLATIENKLIVEYFDKNLKHNELAKYRISKLSMENQKSKPSPIIIGSTKPLPHIVENIRTTFNLPNKISLSWTSNREEDIVFYNLYKKSDIPLIGNLKKEFITKTSDTYYHFPTIKDGQKETFYITAVNKEGLESNFQPEGILGKSLDKPGSPSFISKTIQNGKINFSWNKGDNRNIGYIIKKVINNIEKEIILDINFFEDSNISKGQTISYTIIGFDDNGIQSLPSDKITFEVK